MGMNDMLRKMAVLLERRQDALFSYDVSKQKKYIAKLGNPRDEIERSYFQYKCQMQFNGKGIDVYKRQTVNRLGEFEVQEIIFAIPSMDADKKKALYEYYKNTGYKLKVYDYPTMYLSLIHI